MKVFARSRQVRLSLPIYVLRIWHMSEHLFDVSEKPPCRSKRNSRPHYLDHFNLLRARNIN